MANWFQLPPQTPRSVRSNISAKSLVYLPLHTKIVVTKHLKPIPSKSTGVSSRKTQKVIHVAQERGLNPMLRKNTLMLRCVSLLLACPLLLSFPTMIDPSSLYIQCLKLAPNVMTCSKQTMYHACRHCNWLHKLCLKV